MITSTTVFVLGIYRLTMNSPLHWGVLFLASIGLMMSCVLIFRRFKNADPAILDHKKSSIFSKKLHLSLLVFGNIIAFISVLLFVLPFEMKVQTSSFDVLLTQGFKHTGESDDVNIVGINKLKITQALTSSERIWLLIDQGNKNDNQPFQQWLSNNYQDKIVIIESVQEITDFWSMAIANQSNNDGIGYKTPALVQVFGDGLSNAQWQHLTSFSKQKKLLKVDNLQTINKHAINNIEFRFFTSKPMIGLRNLDWSRELILGQTLTITGQLQQPLDDNIKFELSLVNNNHVLDSIIVQSNESFSLTTISKFSGLFTYQLVLSEWSKGKVSKKTASEISEDISFSVVLGNQPSVLIKQSAPSFETRRLKQWLSQNGSKVRVISKISKSKWAQQKINTIHNSGIESSSLRRKVAPDMKDKGYRQKQVETSHDLDEEILSNYDLLIIDSRMLLALETKEVAALYHAVKQGLGLLINTDATLLKLEDVSLDKRKKLLSLFNISPTNESLNQVIANWPGKPSVDTHDYLLPQSASIGINDQPGQSIVESAAGQSLVAKQSLGLGIVALTALNQTYQWASQVNSAFYSHYWQHLVLQISRNERNTRWVIPESNRVEQVNQFQSLCLISSEDNVVVPQIQLTASPLLNTKKCGRFLAKNEGWYLFQAVNDKQTVWSKQSRYYYSEKDFPAWQQANKHDASQYYAVDIKTLSRTFSGSNVISLSSAYQELNKYVLWLIMFLSLSLLWVERKWQSS